VSSVRSSGPNSPKVIVVGLGPAGPELLTAATLEALATFESARWVRTTRHPCADAFTWTGSFDSVYDGAASVDDVYPAIVDALVDAASASDGATVLYAVPGSPRVAERSVELLVADGRIDVEVLPALSFLDLAWVRLGVDPLRDGVRVVEGHDFAVQAAGERGPLLVSHCHSREVLSDIKLAFGDAVPATVTVIQRLGLADEGIFDVAGADLDRAFEPDHLTSLWIPTLAAPVGAELVRCAELVRTLRERCPWDREQTHQTLTRHLLEEAYEVLETIESLPASYPELEEELGDLLFQVYFHAAIAAEQGEFTLADVARGIHDKLVRRHPHVFADVDADSSEQVVRNWEEIKRAEGGGHTEGYREQRRRVLDAWMATFESR
jgi:tetrapyrrole methylase family protein/MazG family protein